MYEAKVRAYKNNDSANSFYDISHWPTQSRNKAVIAVSSTSSSVWKHIDKVEEQVSPANHQIKAKQDSKTSLISSITPCIINNIYRRKRQSTAAHISANNIRNAVDKAEVEGNGKQQTSIDESSAGVASKSILGKRQTKTDKRQTTNDKGSWLRIPIPMNKAPETIAQFIGRPNESRHSKGEHAGEGQPGEELLKYTTKPMHINNQLLERNHLRRSGTGKSPNTSDEMDLYRPVSRAAEPDASLHGQPTTTSDNGNKSVDKLNQHSVEDEVRRQTNTPSNIPQLTTAHEESEQSTRGNYEDTTPRSTYKSASRASSQRVMLQPTDNQQVAAIVRGMYQSMNPKQRAGARRRLSDIVGPAVMKEYLMDYERSHEMWEDDPATYPRGTDNRASAHHGLQQHPPTHATRPRESHGRPKEQCQPSNRLPVEPHERSAGFQIKSEHSRTPFQEFIYRDPQERSWVPHSPEFGAQQPSPITREPARPQREACLSYQHQPGRYGQNSMPAHIIIQSPSESTSKKPSMKTLDTCGEQALGRWRSQLPFFDAQVERYKLSVNPYYRPHLIDWVDDDVWWEISQDYLLQEDRTTGARMNDAAVEGFLRQRGKYAVDEARRGTVHYASPPEEFMKLK